MPNTLPMWNAVVSSKGRAPVVLSILLAILLAGCQDVTPVAKIGLVAPFEGRQRDVGYDAVYAARLAVREINDRAATDGLRVELVALDDSGDADLARQSAASLVLDPAVVAVVGHWNEETTAAAQQLYADNNLVLLTMGQAPFETVDPAQLPQDFIERYAELTPFDEVAGPYAGATYDAFYLLFAALELAETGGEISRQSVAQSLQAIQYDGVTGSVFQP